MTVRERVRLLRANVEMFGLRNTAKDALLMLLSDPPPDRFDDRYGTQTSRHVLALDGRDGGDLDGARYVPTHEAVMRSVLRTLPIDPGRFVFVDVGCGMGRAVLMAAEVPFRSVVGVELSAQLCAIAQDNVERFTGTRRASSVEIVRADIRAYDLPASDLVLYLYNPFPPPILLPFLDRVEDHARAGHEVLMVYSAHALAGPLLLAHGGLEHVSSTTVIRPEYCWSLWRGRAARP